MEILNLKNKIISFIKIRGPCLPVQIAREIEKSSIIASAFLSELASEKTIRISNMKVGGSPLYFLPGQEEQLEKFSQHLPEKEKQALSLLKENKVLQDEKQEPAIRVALRSIKDFAFPLALKTEETKTIFWHYLTLPEEEAKLKVEELISPKIIQPQLVQAKPELKPLQPQPIKTTIQLQPPLQQPTTQTKSAGVFSAGPK